MQFQTTSFTAQEGREMRNALGAEILMSFHWGGIMRHPSAEWFWYKRNDDDYASPDLPPTKRISHHDPSSFLSFHSPTLFKRTHALHFFLVLYYSNLFLLIKINIFHAFHFSLCNCFCVLCFVHKWFQY